MPQPSLDGAIEEVPLADVLQLLAVGGKTGALHLESKSGRGTIYLAKGEVVHAIEEDAAGEEAAYTLASWSAGRFRFESGTAAPAKTISRSYTALLMEAARRADEWQVIAEKIPSTLCVPRFVVPENAGDGEAQINLNTREWQILSKIDGRRSIREIAQAGGLSTLDTAKLLYGLVSTGLLRLDDPSAS